MLTEEHLLNVELQHYSDSWALLTSGLYLKKKNQCIFSEMFQVVHPKAKKKKNDTAVKRTHHDNLSGSILQLHCSRTIGK